MIYACKNSPNYFEFYSHQGYITNFGRIIGLVPINLQKNIALYKHLGKSYRVIYIYLILECIQCWSVFLYVNIKIYNTSIFGISYNKNAAICTLLPQRKLNSMIWSEKYKILEYWYYIKYSQLLEFRNLQLSILRKVEITQLPCHKCMSVCTSLQPFSSILDFVYTTKL